MIGQCHAGHAVRDGLGDQLFQALPESVLLSRHWPRLLAIQHHRATSAAQVESTFLREHAVGFGDGVVVHAEDGRELANRRQPLARREFTGHQQSTQPADDLFIYGTGCGQVDAQNREVHHGLLYMYSIQMNLECREDS